MKNTVELDWLATGSEVHGRREIELPIILGGTYDRARAWIIHLRRRAAHSNVQLLRAVAIKYWRDMHAMLCLYKQQEMTTKISQVQEHPLNSSRSTSTRFFCIPARRSSPELQLLSYLLLIMATSVTTRSPSTTLLTLGPVLFGAKEGIIDYLKEKKLLNNYTFSL